MDKEFFFLANNAKLYGTLTLPDKGDKFPACLFIGGSFPQTRDGNVDDSNKGYFPQAPPKRNLFLDEAQILKELGVASFRYDKRGCGKSEGNFDTTGLLVLVEDAKQALLWLRKHPKIDSQRVGIIGQSEGARIGIQIATQLEIDFCILQGN